jgi:hypothetical protein
LGVGFDGLLDDTLLDDLKKFRMFVFLCLEDLQAVINLVTSAAFVMTSAFTR